MSFRKVFYGGGGVVYVDSGLPHPGVIYAIQEASRDPRTGQRTGGHLLWYRDDNRQGQNGPNAERGWAPGSGNQIGVGWQNFTYVFSSGSGRDGGGVIYGVTNDGRLLWYRDDNRQGQNGPNAERGWAPGSGNQIGVGWQNFTHVFGYSNHIYAITPDGRLFWYRDDNRQGQNGPNGETGWAEGSGNQIGVGWQNFMHVFAGGSEPGRGIIIYAVTNDGRLLWYRDDNLQGQNGPNGETGWAAGSGNQIGVGW